MPMRNRSKALVIAIALVLLATLVAVGFLSMEPVRQAGVPASTAMPPRPSKEVSPRNAEEHQLDRVSTLGEPLPYTMMHVYFATDRMRDSGGDRPQYSTQRNSAKQPIQYGELDISIPVSHIMGETETDPEWYAYFHKHNPSKYIEIQTGRILSEDELKTLLHPSSTTKELLLFVHGYNNTFDDAAIRTAQIGYDVGFRGRLMFFSWPSMGKAGLYTYDRNNELWASADLAHVLEVLDQSAGLQNVTIIAHSMGNQALADALLQLRGANPTLVTKIGHIIMAAPDVDAGAFTSVFSATFKQAPSTTLYMSSKDVALSSSEALQGGTRLGDERNGPLTYPPIETIDASMVSMGFIGHAYISDSKVVLGDVSQIIATGAPASKRPNLIRASNLKREPYWRLQESTH